MEPFTPLVISIYDGILLLSSCTWEIIPIRLPSLSSSKTPMAFSNEPWSREAKPSSINKNSIDRPHDRSWITSDKPSANALKTLKTSLPQIKISQNLFYLYNYQKHLSQWSKRHIVLFLNREKLMDHFFCSGIKLYSFCFFVKGKRHLRQKLSFFTKNMILIYYEGFIFALVLYYNIDPYTLLE